MAKQSMSKPVKSTGESPKPAQSCQFKNRSLMGVNPKNQQYEPSGSEPVRQRFKMAGGC